MKKSNKNIILKAVQGTLYCTILLVAITVCTSKTQCLEKKLNFETANISNSNKYVYLSDLNYIEISEEEKHIVQNDKNFDGSNITLKVKDDIQMYIKGMEILSKNQLIYDISEISSKYTRFISKIGVDASKTTSNNLCCKILVSDDNNTWNQIYKFDEIVAGKEAIDVELNVENKKYLKICIDSNSENSDDYVVFGGAKFVKKDYIQKPYIQYIKLHKLEYYDDILSTYDLEYNYENNYRLVLEREFVRKIGYYKIQAFINEYPEYKEVFDWILSNNRILEECIEVGNVSDTTAFIDVLAKLYYKYKECLKNENGIVYEKMMIGLAAAYSSDSVSSALESDNYKANYDYIERFRVIKKEFDEGLLLYGEGLKNYHIEMFRMIMQDGANADELIWLNYIGRAKNYVTSVYSYVPYLKANYENSELYNIDNKEKYDKKWSLTENGVPYGDFVKRYWMVMQEGGNSLNQARFIQSIFKNMGSPSIGIYQQQHGSTLYYVPQYDNGTGSGTWRIAGNKLGWGQSCTTFDGKNKTRTLFNWSDKYFTNQTNSEMKVGNSAGYMYLAQANLNNYEVYKKSLYFNLIGNSYIDNEKKLEVYNKSIDVNNINLDSYDYKIQMYKSLDKTSKEWYDLANNIVNNLKFYPMAMNDLLEIIRPYLNIQDRLKIDKIEYEALQRATNASYNEVLQYQACREIAKDILSKIKSDIAYFSFEGDNSNKIVLSSKYDNYDLSWSYSLDGGATKSEIITGHSFKLSDDEIQKITAENGIKIYITGLDLEYIATLNGKIKNQDKIIPNEYENLNNEIIDQSNLTSNEMIEFNDSSKEFKVDNFKVELPDEILNEVSNLEVKSIHLSFDILNAFGFNSEGYEVNLLDGNNNVITTKENNVKLTIDLNKSKIFKGIYKINDDNTVTELEYKSLDNNQIEIETSKLGKYVIYYDEEQEEINSLKNSNKDEQKTIIDNLITIEDDEDVIVLYVVIVSVVVVIVLVIILFKKVLK